MGKKILVFEAYPTFSGSQRITHNMCKAIKQHTTSQIVIVLGDDRYGILQDRFKDVSDIIDSIPVPPSLARYGDEDRWLNALTMLKLGGKLLAFYVRFFLYIKRGNFDFVHYCDPRGAFLAAIPAFFAGAKGIWHVHGKIRLPISLRHFFLAVCSRVLCVSEDVAKTLPKSSKLEVLYNGISFSQYQIKEDDGFLVPDLRRSLINDNDNLPIFLYVGKIRPNKGLHRLLEALCDKDEVLPDFRLVILGDAKTDAEKAYKGYLKKMQEQCGLKSKVHWLGWSDKVLSWMRAADYFVFPTVNAEENIFHKDFGRRIQSSEGLPTVLIESSLSRIFAIAASVTGVSEIIVPGENGIIYDPDDKGALRRSIEHILLERPSFKGFPSASKFSADAFESKVARIFS